MRDPGLMCFLYLPQAGDRHESSFRTPGCFGLLEGSRPRKCSALETATPAAHQPSPAAADSLIRSTLFKGVVERRSVWDYCVRLVSIAVAC